MTIDDAPTYTDASPWFLPGLPEPVSSRPDRTEWWWRDDPRHSGVFPALAGFDFADEHPCLSVAELDPDGEAVGREF